MISSIVLLIITIILEVWYGDMRAIENMRADHIKNSASNFLGYFIPLMYLAWISLGTFALINFTKWKLWVKILVTVIITVVLFCLLFIFLWGLNTGFTFQK